MFKKFDPKEDITGSQQLKSSVQKGIRNKLIEQYPPLEGIIEDILPKKENFKLIKCKDHLEMVADAEGHIQFIKHRDFPYIPVLKLLHKYPFIMPNQRVDKGAIKFVLNGSNIMCPGLTSPGATLLPDCEKGTIVAIMAEGKEHAMAIGIMKLSSQEIKEKNTGIGIDSIHYLCDGLWKLETIFDHGRVSNHKTRKDRCISNGWRKFGVLKYLHKFGGWGLSNKEDVYIKPPKTPTQKLFTVNMDKKHTNCEFKFHYTKHCDTPENAAQEFAKQLSKYINSKYRELGLENDDSEETTSTTTTSSTTE